MQQWRCDYWTALHKISANTVENNFVEIEFVDIQVEYHKNFIEKLRFISMEFRQKLQSALQYFSGINLV